MRYFIYSIIVLALATFCYYAFTDIQIEHQTVTQKIPNERFY